MVVAYLRMEAAENPDDPRLTNQQLIVWTADPSSPSHQALRILASWAANPHEPTGTSPS